MTRRRRNIIIVIISAIVLAGIGIGIYFIFFHGDAEYRIIRVDGGAPVSEFKDSRLEFENDVFAIEIIQNDTVLFIGVGTFRRTRTELRLTFADAWMQDTRGPSPVLARDPHGNYIGHTHTFQISNNTIRFVDNLGNVFYWSQG